MSAVPIETSEARIGPNAILQTADAIRELAGSECLRAVFEAAGLVHYTVAPPTGMVPEREVATLFQELSHGFPEDEASGISRLSGIRTGVYILTHRIPRPAQRLLGALPAALGARLLLRAIARHAWTFSGSGRVSCDMTTPLSLVIAQNPIAMPGCPWHIAVFETLFRAIISADIEVLHPHCQARGRTISKRQTPSPRALSGPASGATGRFDRRKAGGSAA